MKIIGQILINIVLSCGFFLIGYFFASYLQYTDSILSLNEINVIIAVISVGISIFVSVNNWKRTPKLVFDSMLQRNEKDPSLFPLGKQYFLRIKNEKKDTLAKSIRGFITIEDTKIEYKPLLWENNRKEYFDIGFQGDLFLFSIEKTETGYDIKIPFIHSEENQEKDTKYFYPTNLTFEFARINNIIIQIDSENALTPKKPFMTTLEKLLVNSKNI